MKLERFQQLLDAYGADAARWPEAERVAAQALVVSSLPARRAMKRAQALDTALSRYILPATVQAPTEHRLDRLIARTVGLSQLPPRRGPAAWVGAWLGIELNPTLLWPQAAGLLAATVLGFLVGMNGFPFGPDTSASNGSFEDLPTPSIEHTL